MTLADVRRREKAEQSRRLLMNLVAYYYASREGGDPTKGGEPLTEDEKAHFAELRAHYWRTD